LTPIGGWLVGQGGVVDLLAEMTLVLLIDQP
jgi:hypothetical protein